MILLKNIEKFNSLSEFLRFEKFIEDKLGAKILTEIGVEDYYAGVNFKERWFLINDENKVWRLVYPDAPFQGYWGQV